MVTPRRQACCGALSVHAGRLEEGLQRARRLIDVFEQAGVDLIATNAAGCGSNLKDYGTLLAEDPRYSERAAAFSARVRDVSEILAESEPLAERHPLPVRLAFQDSCHLLHAQGVHDAPRTVLGAVPGLEVRRACGAGALLWQCRDLQPRAAAGGRRARRAQGGQYSCHRGRRLCQRESRLPRPGERPPAPQGRPLPAFHPVELLDASIRGVPAEQLLASARR